MAVERDAGTRTVQPAPSHTIVVVGTVREGLSLKAVACRSLDEFHSSFSVTDPTSPLLMATRLALANGASEVHAIRVSNREDPASPPRPSDYRDALDVVAIEVPLADLLLVPSDPFVPASTRHEAWRMASHFCRDRRALLLLDSPVEWFSEVDPFDEWSDLGLVRLRQGLALESAAMFHPRVVLEVGDAKVPAGAAGAVAGLMARLDETRGVWVPPAGREAGILGVVGLDGMPDEALAEDLGSQGVCCLRSTAEGVVNWGARTMAGATDSPWRFIPVRRLALHIQRSVSRGTAWAAGEPNDPLLWQGIQRSVGAFLEALWARGALEGAGPEEAYFVRCGTDTMSEDDIAGGTLRFQVGFAPLRPSEFYVLDHVQRAGPPREGGDPPSIDGVPSQ